MKKGMIAKKDFLHSLKSLLNEYRLIAPAKEDDAPLFKEIDKDTEFALEAIHTINSPKIAFFPQSEVLIRYKKGEKGMEAIKEEIKAKPTLLFGTRPCDAKSFIILDKIFDDKDYPDPYYISKRKNTTIITIGCTHPLKTCFCTTLGDSPFNTEGSDIFLTDLGDEYIVESLTDKGESLLSKFPKLKDMTSSHEEKKKKLEEEATKELVKYPSVDDVKKKLDKIFEHPFWDTLFLKCLGCGTCTYGCPTCHCFDIVDEGNDQGGIRLRNWDSCMYNLFTLHASGHNPRPTQKERIRQRIMHKFKYFIDNYGIVGCVGCGRCVINCPANMDLRKVTKDINEIVEVEK